MKIKPAMKWVFLVGGFLVILLTSLITFWYLRPNSARINPALEWEDWVVISDGRHNSNTDMISWRESFYMAHASSPYHMGTSASKILIKRSSDGKKWDTLAQLKVADEDIRDPKFAVIGDRLFVYALKNQGFYAIPHQTVYAVSEDGSRWSEFKEIPEPKGWLMWRPRSKDGRHWYAPAYWRDHGKCILLKSTDGIHWQEVSQIHNGDGLDETAAHFLPDGRLLCTVRLENNADSAFGSNKAGTLIAVASAPYEKWSKTRSQITRLDGPCLFNVGDQLYAVGRFQPEKDGGVFQMGGGFSKKRTSLFLVKPDGLSYLSDFPSSGDTSYAGAVVKGDYVYVCYYTSEISRDYPWVLGMYEPTEIRMIKIKKSSLAKAVASPLTPEISTPWGTYIVAGFNLLFVLFLIYMIVRRVKPKEEKKEED